MVEVGNKTEGDRPKEVGSKREREGGETDRERTERETGRERNRDKERGSRDMEK